jgi:hypothetical protein
MAMLWIAASVGCAGSSPRSPERLRDRYVEALEDDDPNRVYAMLSPALRAETSYEDFANRWQTNRAEREATRSAAAALPPARHVAVMTGTTAHEDGTVLQWTRVQGRYYVTQGLPGTASTATPAQTIRALIAAVRTTDLSRVRSLLGDAFAASLEQDWSARVEAMESALDRPGSIELSSDLRRAELSYEPGRVLTLEQTPHGWRITSLE